VKTRFVRPSFLVASLALASRAFAQESTANAPESRDSDAPEQRAVVHIETDAPVVLEQRIEGTREWVPACSAPCDTPLRLSASYRIAGSGVRNSPPLRLQASPGERVVLDVNAASSGGFRGGVIATSVGGGVVVAGAIILGLNWFYDGGPNERINALGFVMMGAGAVAAVVGVILLASNGHTNVRESAEIPSRRTDAWLRLPQWNEDKTAVGAPRAVGVRLFEAAF
jgi:hypothetical protein